MHQQLSVYCENASDAKILLVCGRPAAEEYQRRCQPTVRVPLGAGKDALGLELGIVYEGKGQSRRITQLAFFVYRPDFLFCRYDAGTALLMDTAINLAALLTGLESCVGWSYFERRASHTRASGWHLMALETKMLRTVLAEAMSLRRHERVTGTVLTWGDLS